MLVVGYYRGDQPPSILPRVTGIKHIITQLITELQLRRLLQVSTG